MPSDADMTATALPLKGLFLLEPRVFADDRGSFTETWNAAAFAAATGCDLPFVQDNQSVSHAWVLRGLHHQLAPHAQGKLVRVASGAIWDVAVDLRPDSPTIGSHYAVELSAQNGLQLWIPPGFAHGFLSLRPDTQVHYKCTALYHPASERTLHWADPTLAIPWPLPAGVTPLISPKDEQGASFRQLNQV
jgi:dTDP-4-dehydrorhamnose 3,5-epimerase